MQAPIQFIDRTIESIQSQVRPGVTLRKATMGIAIRREDGMTGYSSAFSIARFGARTPRKWARCVWDVVSVCDSLPSEFAAAIWRSPIGSQREIEVEYNIAFLRPRIRDSIGGEIVFPVIDVSDFDLNGKSGIF